MTTITSLEENDNWAVSRWVINTNIDNLNTNKVEVESWKGLSTNDFTDADEVKLNWIEAWATTDQDLSWLQETSEKGIANWYAPLDNDWKVPEANLPASASGVSSVNWESWDVVLDTDDISEWTNKYITEAELIKLDWIEPWAEVNIGVEYTQIEKDKLTGIENGAEVNEVTLLWAETLENKDLTNINNHIHADLIHFKIKSTTSALVAWQPIKIDSWDDGASVLKVSLATDSDIAIWIVWVSAAQWVQTWAVQTWAVRWLDTSALNIWDVLWMTSAPWVLSTTMPEANWNPVAVVIRSHNSDWIIEVNMTKGYRGYEFSQYYKDQSDKLITIQDAAIDPTWWNREDRATFPTIEFCTSASSWEYKRIDSLWVSSTITWATTFWDWTTALADRTLAVRPDDNAWLTEYSYFHYWVKYVKNTTETIQNWTDEGKHIFVFNGANIEVAYTIHDAIVKDTLISIVYCDWEGNYPLFADERHWKDMSGIVHEMMHNTFGAQYETWININWLADGQETYTETTSWIARDEDLQMTPWLQSVHPFIYREWTNWAWKWTTPDNRVAYSPSRDNTTDAQWNEYTWTTWQLTTSGSSTDYIINFYMLTNDGKYPVVKLIGQWAYSSRSNARDAIESEMNKISLGWLPSPEFIFLYATIVRRNTDLENLADWSTYLDLRISKWAGGGWTSGTATYAENVNVDTTNFDNILSSADDTVQKALETIDDYVPTGWWDMLKSVYDTDNNWVVDNSEKVNNLTVETAVPSWAVFTDTTYTDVEIKTKYENNADTNAYTDAEKTVVGNTSWTNTWDQDLSWKADLSWADFTWDVSTTWIINANSALFRKWQSWSNPTWWSQVEFGYNNWDDYKQYITTTHNSASSSNRINFYTSDWNADWVLADAIHWLTIENWRLWTNWITSPKAQLEVGWAFLYWKNLNLATWTDLDTIIQPWFYDCNDATNAPEAWWFHYEVRQYSWADTFIVQKAYWLTSWNYNDFYHRTNYGWTRSNWVLNIISDNTETWTDKVNNIVSCTQAEYDALTPVATTFYIITD